MRQQPSGCQHPSLEAQAGDTGPGFAHTARQRLPIGRLTGGCRAATLAHRAATSRAGHAPGADHPRKGSIAVGADADLVIWDKDREVVIANDILHHDCDYTPYEGMRVRGWPAVVLSRGEVVVDEGKLLAQPGQGRFLRCARPARQQIQLD